MMIVHMESVAPRHNVSAIMVDTVAIGLQDDEDHKGVVVSVTRPDQEIDDLRMLGAEKVKVTSMNGEWMWTATVHGCAGETHPQDFDLLF